MGLARRIPSSYPQQWLKFQSSLTQPLLETIGLSAPEAQLAGFALITVPYTIVLYPYATVQEGLLSETEPLNSDVTMGDGSKINYISWLRRATVADLVSFSVKSESKLRSFSWAIQLNEKKVFHLNRIICI